MNLILEVRKRDYEEKQQKLHATITEKRLLSQSKPEFFFYLVCEAIGTAATPGLLCQPRVIVKMILEKQMESR
jgi:hypothetical protein